MSQDAIFFLAAVLPMTVIVGGVLIILMGMRQRALTLEMKHRERMAMIERGIVPGPARDPAAFEAWQDRHDRPTSRSTTIGVVVVAIGLSLILMIGFAGGERGAAIGVGGSIVVLGVAFIVNGELLQRRSYPPPPSSGGYSVSRRPPPIDSEP